MYIYIYVYIDIYMCIFVYIYIYHNTPRKSSKVSSKFSNLHPRPPGEASIGDEGVGATASGRQFDLGLEGTTA